MRFFQQRRTQRENQINHKIDEKQKQLAELHSQPESATGHAVVVFQLQEERNRFVSLFKGKLETSKKKRRMHLLNKVFVAAKMPPFSFRLSSRSELTSILEDSDPPPESSRLSERTLRRVGVSESSAAPPALSSPPPSPPASASEAAAATTSTAAGAPAPSLLQRATDSVSNLARPLSDSVTNLFMGADAPAAAPAAAPGSEERAVDYKPALEPLVYHSPLEDIEHAAHEVGRRSSIVAQDIAHAVVEAEHAVEHAVVDAAHSTAQAVVEAEHAVEHAVEVAVAAIAGSRPPLRAASFKPVRVQAAPEPSDIEWENMHVKQAHLPRP